MDNYRAGYVKDKSQNIIKKKTEYIIITTR